MPNHAPKRNVRQDAGRSPQKRTSAANDDDSWIRRACALICHVVSLGVEPVAMHGCVVPCAGPRAASGAAPWSLKKQAAQPSCLYIYILDSSVAAFTVYRVNLVHKSCFSSFFWQRQRMLFRWNIRLNQDKLLGNVFVLATTAVLSCKCAIRAALVGFGVGVFLQALARGILTLNAQF